MLKERLREELKLAMKAKDKHKLSTLRLILAALKDRDIAARGNGQADGVGDDDILQLLTKMVKQRRESIRLYEQGGRTDLAGREAEEITIIETFLPRRLDDDETAAAIAEVIDDVNAKGLKDMGATMTALKKRYAGRMDFSKVGLLVKQRLV